MPGVDEVSLIAALPSLVHAGWGQCSGPVSLTDAGMNSTTVFVEVNGHRYVAKWVPAGGAAALDHGSAIAARLATFGLATGDPLPTTAGELSFTTLDGGRVALLRYVPGAPLIGETDADQQLMGTALARVHTVDVSPNTSRPFMAETLELAQNVETWIRPAVAAAMAEYLRLPL